MNTNISAQTKNKNLYEIGNPSVNSLIDQLNWDKDHQSLIVSNWKDKLSEISTWEIIKIIQILNSQKDSYTGKILVPNLSEGLNINSIDTVLSSLNRSYTEALRTEKNIHHLREDERNKIIEKLKELYKKDFLHNRLLLGIFLQIHKKAPELENYESNFIKNIKEWLFTGEDSKELRDEVTKPNDLPNQKDSLVNVLQG